MHRPHGARVHVRRGGVGPGPVVSIQGADVADIKYELARARRRRVPSALNPAEGVGHDAALARHVRPFQDRLEMPGHMEDPGLSVEGSSGCRRCCSASARHLQHGTCSRSKSQRCDGCPRLREELHPSEVHFASLGESDQTTSLAPGARFTQDLLQKLRRLTIYRSVQSQLKAI